MEMGEKKIKRKKHVKICSKRRDRKKYRKTIRKKRKKKREEGDRRQ